jgi:hypothetical protein
MASHLKPKPNRPKTLGRPAIHGLFGRKTRRPALTRQEGLISFFSVANKSAQSNGLMRFPSLQDH